MNQPTLFGDNLARTTDPGTSHKAAEQVAPKLGRLRSRMLSAFGKNRTANEAAHFCVLAVGGTHESYRKRTHELLDLGLIVCDGERTCRITGRTARTFRAV